MSKLCGEMLRRRKHAHIFCSVLQVASGYWVLTEGVEVQEGTFEPGSDSDGEEKKEPMFLQL